MRDRHHKQFDTSGFFNWTSGSMHDQNFSLRQYGDFYPKATNHRRV